MSTAGPCGACGTRRRPSAGPPGLRRRVVGSSAASCSAVPAATIWPAPLTLAGVSPSFSRCEDLVAVAAEQGGHAGLGARGGLGHRQAPLADEEQRLLVGEHTGERGGGDLADAVAGEAPTAPGRVAGPPPSSASAETGRGDQQRLGDGGVADRVRVGLGAVVGRSSPMTADSQRGGRREPRSSQGVRKPGVWAPWPGATSTSTGTLCPTRARSGLRGLAKWLESPGPPAARDEGPGSCADAPETQSGPRPGRGPLCSAGVGRRPGRSASGVAALLLHPTHRGRVVDRYLSNASWTTSGLTSPRSASACRAWTTTDCGVDVEEPACRRTGVGEAEAVGAEGVVVARDPLARSGSAPRACSR